MIISKLIHNKLLKIESFNQNHERKVENLFETVFQRKPLSNFFKWRCYNFGEPIRYVMKHDEKIVGHYVLHQIPFKMNNTTENILFSMTSMTHPDFRNKGVYKQLANYVYQIAYDKNFKFAIGFSNFISYKIHFEKLDWINLGRPIEYYKKCQLKNSRNKQSQYHISPIIIFDEKIDDIWNKHKEDFDFLIPRTSNYLKWRFNKQPKPRFSDYPSENYFPFLVKNKNEPIAYFILKQFGNEKVHIVDFFGNLNKSVLKVIFDFAENFCIKIGVLNISFWCSLDIESNKLQDTIKQFNFHKRNAESFFGIRIFNKKFNYDRIRKKNWFITMSDSDVF